MYACLVRYTLRSQSMAFDGSGGRLERSISELVLVARLGVSLDTLFQNEWDLLPSEITEL